MKCKIAFGLREASLFALAAIAIAAYVAIKNS
jgi:hypothetical protein